MSRPIAQKSNPPVKVIEKQAADYHAEFVAKHGRPPNYCDMFPDAKPHAKFWASLDALEDMMMERG